MPKIDMQAYEAASDGGFKQLLPGAYVVSIMKVLDEFEEMDWDLGARVLRTAEKDRAVMLVFDIAEGEFAGEFSRDYYMDGDEPAENKCWMHQMRYSWDDEPNYRDFKRFNSVLQASNPGFDPMAAFTADKWDLYVGKRFGIVLNGTVSTNDDGYDRWTLRPSWRPYTVDDVHAGKTPEPRITDKREKREESSFDVPF